MQAQDESQKKTMRTEHDIEQSRRFSSPKSFAVASLTSNAFAGLDAGHVILPSWEAPGDSNYHFHVEKLRVQTAGPVPP